MYLGIFHLLNRILNQNSGLDGFQDCDQVFRSTHCALDKQSSIRGAGRFIKMVKNFLLGSWGHTIIMIIIIMIK